MSNFNESSFYVILSIFLAFLVILFVLELKEIRGAITDYLKERGATNINVYHEWLDFDRDTISFFVEYTGYAGNKQTTTCKVHLGGHKMYWSEPLDLELKQPQKSENRSNARSLSLHNEFSEQIRARSDINLPTYNISILLPIPHSEDKIVMLDHTDSFRNVIRCKPDGTIVWQAKLPTDSSDVYTNVEWKSQHLTAFSRSCFNVILNVEDGSFVFAG